VTDVNERSSEVAGLEIHTREAPAPGGGRAPILYLHGVPTAGWDWTPFLERAGGVAPDLPGFGRSAKPAGFDYSIDGYADFLEAFTAAEGLERFSLVMHDWGAVGLAFAQRHPERIERLVLVNVVPFVPGYRWHRIARLWRTPVIGELTMGFTTKFGLKQLSKEAFSPGPAPDGFLDAIWENFDHGTQRAILKLYRASPSDMLERAGARLGEIGAPALVAWGTEDPYLGPELGPALAATLGAELETIERAGHWPWLDRPELIDGVVEFLRR
jgi:pimeloyl-ACP methyl ester carboxylesterase